MPNLCPGKLEDKHFAAWTENANKKTLPSDDALDVRSPDFRQ